MPKIKMKRHLENLQSCSTKNQINCLTRGRNKLRIVSPLSAREYCKHQWEKCQTNKKQIPSNLRLAIAALCDIQIYFAMIYDYNWLLIIAMKININHNTFAFLNCSFALFIFSSSLPKSSSSFLLRLIISLVFTLVSSILSISVSIFFFSIL